LSLTTDNDRVSGDREAEPRFRPHGADLAQRLRAGPWLQLMAVYTQLMAALAGASRDGGRALVHIGTARTALSIAMEELQQIARGFHPAPRAEDTPRILTETKLGHQAELTTAPHRSHRAGQRQREIERDLHDGAQQRLVSLDVTLQLAERQGASVASVEMTAFVAGLRK
jgi:hypothetical protein